MTTQSLNVESAVRDRYGAAAQEAEAALCCPVSYDARYLEIIPQEIIERDYGCGDPSQHLQPGDHVLDLGSGGGKICYIASQVVGRDGYVVGVDVNDDMLDLARRHQAPVADSIGYLNTDFRKGKIQDLQLNLELFEQYLREHPVSTAADWLAADEAADELRRSQPLVATNSMDAVVSNCVLNLVRRNDREQLFHEVHRVLKRGGRAIISDIVSDEDVPEHLQNDPRLWSGCISGSYREDQFLQAFEDAGFYGIEILNRQEDAWAVVEGIEFRSVTVRAWKGKDGICLDRRHAAVYRGPWKAVVDDNDQTLYRGQRMAVCEKTFHMLGKEPYADKVIQIPPKNVPAEETARELDCSTPQIRTPEETKTGGVSLEILPGGDCCGETGCC